jgi:hypothetical protein
VARARIACFGVILVGAAGCASLPRAFTVPPTASSENVRTETVAPGVTLRYITELAGPFVLRVVTVDLRSTAYELRHVRARDSLAGRERLSAMVARQPEGAARVVAAINADFFSLATGETENNVVIAGEWWKGTHGTVSPFDSWDNIHSQFGVSANGRPLIDRFAFRGTAIRNGAAFPITALNAFTRGGSEAAVLYTPRFGVTPSDTVRPMAEVALRQVARRGDTLVFVQAGAPVRAGRNAVPRDGAVLAAYGARANTVARFVAGDTILALLQAAGARGDAAPISPRLLIGGWPRILRAGRNVAAQAPWDEGTVSSNAEARHPRSAIGFSRDSTMLYLVTVDGRQQASVGMTLVELAEFMLKQGVWDALNFDGGGSTTLIVKGATVNTPSDAGSREIANALLVVARP